MTEGAKREIKKEMTKAIKQQAKGRQRMTEIQGQMENLVPCFGSRWQGQTDTQRGRWEGSKRNGISVVASINTVLKKA